MSFRVFTFVASFRYDFREVKKLLSGDCSSWLQSAGKQKNWIHKSSVTSSTYMSKWLRFPSTATRVLSWQPMIVETLSASTELFLYMVPNQNCSRYQVRRQIILSHSCPLYNSRYQVRRQIIVSHNFPLYNTRYQVRRQIILSHSCPLYNIIAAILLVPFALVHDIYVTVSSRVAMCTHLLHILILITNRCVLVACHKSLLSTLEIKWGLSGRCISYEILLRCL
jgi:hypothetical protein